MLEDSFLIVTLIWLGTFSELTWTASVPLLKPTAEVALLVIFTIALWFTAIIIVVVVDDVTVVVEVEEEVLLDVLDPVLVVPVDVLEVDDVVVDDGAIPEEPYSTSYVPEDAV